MFQWINQDKPAPEALELEAKQQQFESLEERYAEVQTDYATLQNTLAAFKQRYWQRVGHLYARLDEVRAESAAIRVRLAPHDALCQSALRSAATQAHASAEAARDINLDLDYVAFEPSEELRKYYRLAAKIVHPDRAEDEDDRNLRDEIMSRINVAYRDGHVYSIQALIDEYQMRAQPAEDDAATRLIRTIRLISRIREQISEISQATVTLRESGLYRLFKTVEEAAVSGIDKLRVIEVGIERDIERAQAELQRLNLQWAERVAALAVAQEAALAVELDVAEAAESDTATEVVGSSADDGCDQEEPTEVRAETEIAILLLEQRVTWSFRLPLDGDGAPTPAFTIQDGAGRRLLWEHLSGSSGADSEADWPARFAWYAANGFDAGVNLFVTRDEPDGSVDLARLRKVASYLGHLVGPVVGFRSPQ